MLYADKNNYWISLSWSFDGECPPARIGRYELMGETNDCVRWVYEWINEVAPWIWSSRGGAKAIPVQQMMADRCGAAQTTVSTWLTGASVPRLEKLPPEGAQWLVRMIRCARLWQQSLD